MLHAHELYVCSTVPAPTSARPPATRPAPPAPPARRHSGTAREAPWQPRPARRPCPLTESWLDARVPLLVQGYSITGWDSAMQASLRAGAPAAGGGPSAQAGPPALHQRPWAAGALQERVLPPFDPITPCQPYLLSRYGPRGLAAAPGPTHRAPLAAAGPRQRPAGAAAPNHRGLRWRAGLTDAQHGPSPLLLQLVGVQALLKSDRRCHCEARPPGVGGRAGKDLCGPWAAAKPLRKQAFVKGDRGHSGLDADFELCRPCSWRDRWAGRAVRTCRAAGNLLESTEWPSRAAFYPLWLHDDPASL